jgi:allophanate hydrolase subunit 2
LSRSSQHSGFTSPLHQSDSSRTTHDIQNDARTALEAFNNSSPETPRTGVFDQHMLLWVEVQGSSRPIIIKPDRQLLIGRHDPAAGIVPEIDLSPHAGYQFGISRRHASIRWQDNQLYIIDLGSRNGTYVNGKRVDMHHPFKLHDGDVLHLGKITLRLFFRSDSDAARG